MTRVLSVVMLLVALLAAPLVAEAQQSTVTVLKLTASQIGARYG